MTVGISWMAERKDGRQYLYFATDSRVRGNGALDVCPKILTLPRSDCAISFAGDTGKCYPLMLQLQNAIMAHEPARERSLDITKLKSHILRVFTDIVGSIQDPAAEFRKDDAEFIFGGFSWLKGEFAFWNVYYEERRKAFAARPASTNFHPLLPHVAFIGDRKDDARRLLQKNLRQLAPEEEGLELQPLRVLAEMLASSSLDSTIGGPPQVVRVAAHMNTRPFVVRWKGQDTLFGRPLFEYENTDFFSIEAETLKRFPPRKYGARNGEPASD